MKKTVDDIFKMCESRYALVNLVANKAREIAHTAEEMGEPLIEKPVNVVIGNLISGKSVIVKPAAPITSRISIDFSDFSVEDEADVTEDEIIEAQDETEDETLEVEE